MVKANDLKQGLSAELNITAAPTITINHLLLFLGSCFSENIGIKMAQLGFETLINPFGIIYNPISLANMIENICKNQHYTAQELFFFNGKFHSLDHHGALKSENAPELLSEINGKVAKASNFVKKTNTVVITLGTAYVYTLVQENRIVANCHKLPASEFSKRLLSEDEIVQSCEKMVRALVATTPGIEIIFTISPVKHLREGIVENAVSKARLLSGLSHFLQNSQNTKTSYFPAFEIVTEELRDYRFYEADLAHPSQWTILYIFRKFLECKLDSRCKEYIDSAVKFARMNTHRPISKMPAELDKWNQSKMDFLEKIKLEFPDKNWESIAFEPL